MSNHLWHQRLCERMHTPAAAARRAFYVCKGLRAVKAAAKAPEKGGLGRPQGRRRARRRSRGAGRGVKSGGATGLGLCERAAGERRGDGVCRHGRRPGGGAQGAQPRRPPRAKKHRLAKAPVLSKNPDKIQVIIAKNKPYMLHTACFFLIRI